MCPPPIGNLSMTVDSTTGTVVSPRLAGRRAVALRPLAGDLSRRAWTGLALALLLMVAVPLSTGVVATLGARAVAARQAEVDRKSVV